jgi:hypothetical protein
MLGGRVRAQQLGSLFQIIIFIHLTATRAGKAEIPLQLEKASPTTM